MEILTYLAYYFRNSVKLFNVITLNSKTYIVTIC